MIIKIIDSYEIFEEFLNKFKYVIVNISASWCKPCMLIKPQIEKFIQVINEDDFVYLKIDNSIYETDDRFHNMFHMKKIPYFGMIYNKELKYSIVSGDFSEVSKKIYEFIKLNKTNETNILNDFDNNKDF